MSVVIDFVPESATPAHLCNGQSAKNRNKSMSPNGMRRAPEHHSDLGEPETISEAFSGFQKFLYEPAA
ncbi:MAG: hypothetical protein ABI600_11125 [Luteolibacter sp.]